MSDDKHARMLLRNLHLEVEEDPEQLGKRWVERERSRRRLLDRAVDLMRRYGLDAGEPLIGSNVDCWSFRRENLNLRIRSGAGSVIRGMLREQDHEHGGTVGQELEVTVAELAFDLDDGEFYGRDGRSGIDVLVAGLLEVLRAG